MKSLENRYCSYSYIKYIDIDRQLDKRIKNYSINQHSKLIIMDEIH